MPIILPCLMHLVVTHKAPPSSSSSSAFRFQKRHKKKNNQNIDAKIRTQSHNTLCELQRVKTRDKIIICSTQHIEALIAFCIVGGGGNRVAHFTFDIYPIHKTAYFISYRNIITTLGCCCERAVSNAALLLPTTRACLNVYDAHALYIRV